MRYKLLLILSFLLGFENVKAEAAYELYLPVSNYFGNSNLFNIGVGARGLYFLDDWTGVYGSVNYNLPTSLTGTIEFSAINGLVVPSSLIKDVRCRLNSFQFGLGGRRYLIGNYLGDSRRKFGLSVIAELGLLFGSYIAEVPEFDSSKYESLITEENEGGFVNYLASVGFEGDYVFLKYHLFSELRFGASIDQANRKLVDVKLPAFFNFNLGVRIPFGNN